ncbi:MAG: ribosome maturation factor RimM [Anaerolineae bacterium]|nr:ribosome maturation factor RimM [Anaerolineae bacterium]
MISKKILPIAEAGSLIDSEPEYLEVGLIRRPHGLKGEMLLVYKNDFTQPLDLGTSIFLGDHYQSMEISSSRPHLKGHLVRFSEVNDREQAGLFRNTRVYIPFEKRPVLPEGEYYHDQLLNLNVVSDEGRELGRIADIIVTGANDVYVIKGEDDQEILIPSIPSVILNVDLANHLMEVHLLEGLI